MPAAGARGAVHTARALLGVTSAHLKDGGSLIGEIVGIFRFPRTGGAINFICLNR